MIKTMLKIALCFIPLLGTDKVLSQNQSTEKAKRLSQKRLPMDQFADRIIKDSLRAILYRVEVCELNKKLGDEQSSGFDMGEQFFYMGALPTAIARLTNYSIARIKMVGQVPDKAISYWGERYNSDYEKIGRTVVKPKKKKKVPQDNLAASVNATLNPKQQSDPANIMILNTLKMTYDFYVVDIEDTCEVWIAKVINEKKLSTFVNTNGSNGSGPKDKDGKHYLELNSTDLSSIWSAMEIGAKHIVYDETGDTRNFDMFIEYVQLNNFDTANTVLAPYGLGLVKEKRLEKIKLVTFQE